MRIAWSGLIFHVVILLWSFEDGQNVGKNSELCLFENRTLYSRVVLVSLPGLNRNHVSILETIPGILTDVRTPESGNGYLSLTAGLDKTPLFPGVIDDIFLHANTTVFSGALPAPRPTIWTKLGDVDYNKESGKTGDKEVFENLKQMLMESLVDGDLGAKLKAESVIYVLRLLGYFRTKSMDILRETLRNVRSFKEGLDEYYGDTNTTVILWGEGNGPILLWGSRLENGKSHLRSNNLTALISALLRREVPAGCTGILPDDYLKNDEDRAHGLYCNALQLCSLAEESQGDQDVIKFWSRFDVNYVFKKLKDSKSLLHQGNFKEAKSLSRNAAQFCHSQYTKFKRILKQWRIGLMTFGNVMYMIFLLTELAYDETIPNKPFALVYVHLFFCGLTCCVFSLPFITPWPHTYHLYLQIPHVFLWGILSRYYIWLPKLKMSNLRKIVKACCFGFILFVASEFSLMNSLTTSSFFICVLSLLPTLPRFSKAPLIITTGWFLMNASLLGALHLPILTKAEPKAINFSATIALCASGFAALWVRPLKDRILSMIITILIAIGMLVENMALSYKGDIWFLQYVSWPLMLSPLLSLFGESNRFNRITHIITSSSIVFIMTSARFEGICFFTVMSVVWLWTLMESYKLKEQSNCESIRRSVFLVFLILIAQQVTKTLPDAYRPFKVDEYTYSFDLYREFLISGSILGLFLTMMDSEPHAYKTVLLSMVMNSMASLRTILIPGDVAHVQMRGITFIMAYYFASLLRGKVKNKSEDFFNQIPVEQH